jgi:peptidoglycan/xylan/chitin deacetylase (PgdA/CDA1 family)
MRLLRPPYIAAYLYPDAIFRIKTAQKVLYLTFDDGPDPESTPQLLVILKNYNIKSVFFCSGKQAEKYPELIEHIKSEGHLVGNHGYNHLNGFVTPDEEYYSDVETAAGFTSEKIFRPPYGRIKIRQYKKLKEFYRIFFWDLMPYDFDSSFGRENTLMILKDKIRPGSVIVLHDKSISCVNEILEPFIEFASNEGYRIELPYI